MKYFLAVVAMVLVGHSGANRLESQALSGAFLHTVDRASAGVGGDELIVSASNEGTKHCYGSIYLSDPSTSTNGLNFLGGGRIRMVHPRGPGMVMSANWHRFHINITAVAQYLSNDAAFKKCLIPKGHTKIACVSTAVVDAYCGAKGQALRGTAIPLKIKEALQGDLDMLRGSMCNAQLENLGPPVATSLYAKLKAATGPTPGISGDVLSAAIRKIGALADIPGKIDNDVKLLEIAIDQEGKLKGVHVSSGHLLRVTPGLDDQKITKLKDRVKECVYLQNLDRHNAASVQKSNVCMACSNHLEPLREHLCFQWPTGVAAGERCKAFQNSDQSVDGLFMTPKEIAKYAPDGEGVNI